jgi:hypothetical protein
MNRTAVGLSRPSTQSSPMNTSEWIAGGAAWMAGTSPAMTKKGGLGTNQRLS